MTVKEMEDEMKLITYDLGLMNIQVGDNHLHDSPKQNFIMIINRCNSFANVQNAILMYQRYTQLQFALSNRGC